MARRRPRQAPPASSPAPTSTGPPPAATPAPPASRRHEVIPQWLQAVTGVVAVLLTALALFGIVRGPDAAPTTPTGPGGTIGASAAAVTLRTVVTAGTEIHGTGDFSDLDPGSEAILFIGQPAAAAKGDWLPVVASLSFDTPEPAGRKSGHWLGVRPVPPAQPYVWYAVIAPRADGAGDGYADLRANGPASGLVKAKSEPQTTP
jgi:hypothetical protein